MSTHNDLAFNTKVDIIVEPERYSCLLLQVTEDDVDRLHRYFASARHCMYVLLDGNSRR